MSYIRIIGPFYLLCIIIGAPIFCDSTVLDQKIRTCIIAVPDLEHELSKINSFLPHPCTINDIKYTCSIPLPDEEMFYLTEIQPHKMLSADHLKKAIFYLSKKNKFETIIVKLTELPNNTHTIHFTLKARWIFAKLKCTGFLLNKDTYRQYYLMQPGDPFDLAKHTDSCNAIKQTFFRQGYCQSKVISTIERNKKQQSVTVTLNLQPGPQYTIGTVLLKLTGAIFYDLDVLSKNIQKKFLNTLSGKIYNKETITTHVKSLHNYLTQNGFFQSTIMVKEACVHAKSRINITLHINLHHKHSFDFSGNIYFSAEQLRTLLLELGSSMVLLPSDLLAQELQKIYYDHGFLHAQVIPQESKNHTLFNILEGERSIVTAIECKSTQSACPAHINAYFAPLLKHVYFNATLLQKCLDSCIQFYLQQGFWRVSVVKKEIVPSQTGVSIYITIDEQERTYLGQVHVANNNECDQQLKKFLATQNGEHLAEQLPIPFTITTIQQQRELLTRYLQAHHYPPFDLAPACTPQGNKIDIEWHIKMQKKPKFFGKTIIQTADTIDVDAIKRELAYQAYDQWNVNALQETRNNLKELNIFDHISVEPDYSFPYEDELPIILKAYSIDPIEVRARAGFALRQLSKHFAFGGCTYTAGGTVLYKNPFHKADLIRINVDISRSHRIAQFQYHIPWFFRWPIRTLFEAYTHTYIQPGITNELKNIYKVSQQGFLLNTHRTLSHIQAGNVLGIEWIKTKICAINSSTEDHIAQAINFSPQLLDENIAYAIIEPSLFINYLDNPLEPTQGSFSLISIKGMFPLHPIGVRGYFLKIIAEQSVFIPLASCTIALRGKIGHIFHEQFSTIPPIERFYLGGSHSIRSYETDMVPPLGKVVDKNHRTNLIPQGGKSMFNCNIELRFPLYRELSGVIFQDIGALSTTSFAHVQKENIALGTGLGIRYSTPIGPVRFDIAFKWSKPDACISGYAWFLTIGHPF